MDALRERECGAKPEGAPVNYYWKRYDNYIGMERNETNWEAMVYFSEESFDPDNYNEESI